MAAYDLTHTLAPYLDRHLLFPLMEFLSVKQLYPEEELLKTKLDLLSKTKMVDFATDIYKKLYKTEEVPEAMKVERDQVISKFKEFQNACAPILQVVNNQNLLKQLRTDKQFNMQHLKEHFQVTEESLDALYNYAKFQFDCGAYSNSAEYLQIYRSLSNNLDKCFSALWGKFASEILMQNWEEAIKDMNQLKDAIDSSSKMTCPHILRYLATAVVANKKRRSSVKDLVKVIQQESYTYKDPITEFLEALYVNFDFEDAQVKLRECEKVLMNDFFLVVWRDEFIESARLFIFETYCRIHQCIDLGMLAEKLNMDVEAAERWIVNLIRNAKLDAKIDSKANHVIMGVRSPSVYQKIIEKTKGLTFRTYVLADSLSKSEEGAAPYSGEEEEASSEQQLQYE